MGKILSEKNFIKIYIISMFILAYIFPTKLFQDFFNLPVDSYLYGGFTLVLFLFLIIKKRQNIYRKYLFFLIIVFFIVMAQKHITALHLLGLILIDYISCNREDYLDEINQEKKYAILGCGGLILYSIVYFGKMDRFAYLGIGEVNISGLGIFLLGCIVKKKYKRLAIFIWVIGILTLSRNYLMALLVYTIVSVIMSKRKKWGNNKILGLFSFGKLGVLSTIILIWTSNIYQRVYLMGGIKNYNDGIGRFVNFFDLSNYNRFIVNTNVLEIYKRNLKLLFTGIPNNKFSEYNLIVCKELGCNFSYDRPHNFFFSYIQIYGIYAILIFAFMAHFFSVLVNRNNFAIFLAMMCYGFFLGMGFSSYWLWVFVVSLIVNR